jgi:hypothetical protein
MVQGALACGDAGSVRKETAGRRATSEVALRRRLHARSGKAILRKMPMQPELARYVMTVLQGWRSREPTAPVPINYVESRKRRCAHGQSVSLSVTDKVVLLAEFKGNRRVTFGGVAPSVCPS